MSGCPEVKNERYRRKEEGERMSTEEMKNKPRDDREEDTEEMIEWRSVRQEEMDQCWKKLAEKIEEEVLDTNKVNDSKRGFIEAEALR